jgi:hypothetical protein
MGEKRKKRGEEKEGGEEERRRREMYWIFIYDDSMVMDSFMEFSQVGNRLSGWYKGERHRGESERDRERERFLSLKKTMSKARIWIQMSDFKHDGKQHHMLLLSILPQSRHHSSTRPFILLTPESFSYQCPK